MVPRTGQERAARTPRPRTSRKTEKEQRSDSVDLAATLRPSSVFYFDSTAAKKDVDAEPVLEGVGWCSVHEA